MAVRKEYNQSWNPFWLNMPETELPIAGEDQLGGVKVGDNLTIEDDGTLNAEAGGGGTPSVVKIAGGTLWAALQQVKNLADGGKIVADYVEYPMVIPTSESGEQYNYGMGAVVINQPKIVSDGTNYYGLSTFMFKHEKRDLYVDGELAGQYDVTATQVKINAQYSTETKVRFTDAVITLEKQETGYTVVIEFSKAFLVPDVRTRVQISEIHLDSSSTYNTNSQNYYKCLDADPYNPTATNPRLADMFDITGAMRFNSQYRTVSGKYKILFTVSEDFGTFALVTDNSAYNTYPQFDDDWEVTLMEAFDNFLGIRRPEGSLYFKRDVSLISGTLGGLQLFRYIDVSDGVALV